MKTYLLVVLAMVCVACGGAGLSPTMETEKGGEACEVNADCHPDHKYCDFGVCTGDPVPEGTWVEESDVVTADADNTGSDSSVGPWGDEVNYEDVVSVDVEDSTDDAAEEVDVDEDVDLPSECNDELCVGQSAQYCAADNQVCVVCECQSNSCECEEDIVLCENGCYLGECLPESIEECEDASDCDDGDSCTNDACLQGECHNIDSPCLYGCLDGKCQGCAGDDDCMEGDQCTLDKCIANECKHYPIQNCCSSNDECDDGNDCTADLCSSNSCLNEAIPNCGETGCTSDEQCDDDDACTFNDCMNGECHFDQLPYCQVCESDVDCTPEAYCVLGNVFNFTGNCLTDVGKCELVYVGCNFGCEAGACLPEPSECSLNGECDDGNSCTMDNCVYGECTHAAQTGPACGNGGICVSGECEMVECVYECAPSENPCFMVYCENFVCNEEVMADDYPCGDNKVCSAGVCVVQSECTQSSQCDDSNACTTNLCVQGSCQYTALENCITCTQDNECGGAAVGCIGGDWYFLVNNCVSNGMCAAANLDCEFGCDQYGCLPECEDSEECDDGNPCTEDTCEEGSCVNYEGTSLCVYCEVDAECEEIDHCADNGNAVAFSGECVGNTCPYEITSCPADCNGGVCDEVECVSDADCFDGDNCTDDQCNNNNQCSNYEIEYCSNCVGHSDCSTEAVCDMVGGGVFLNLGQCEAGVCQTQYSVVESAVLENGCYMPIECDIQGECPGSGQCVFNNCYYFGGDYPECLSSADCLTNVGQYCNPSTLMCAYSGNLQCTVECPNTKTYAVVWYGSGQEAMMTCNNPDSVWSVSKTELCLWGSSNPTFKMNLWDGAFSWSQGDQAVLNCNNPSVNMTPDPDLAWQGVQVVSFADLNCGN